MLELQRQLDPAAKVETPLTQFLYQSFAWEWRFQSTSSTFSSAVDWLSSNTKAPQKLRSLTWVSHSNSWYINSITDRESCTLIPIGVESPSLRRTVSFFLSARNCLGNSDQSSIYHLRHSKLLVKLSRHTWQHCPMETWSIKHHSYLWEAS